MSVSVVMPAKNAAAHLREAVESVFAQGSAVREIIIVDDGSTDGTAALVRGFGDNRIRLLSNERPGVSAARNLGKTRTKFVGLSEVLPSTPGNPAYQASSAAR